MPRRNYIRLQRAERTFLSCAATRCLLWFSFLRRTRDELKISKELERLGGLTVPFTVPLEIDSRLAGVAQEWRNRDSAGGFSSEIGKSTSKTTKHLWQRVRVDALRVTRAPLGVENGPFHNLRVRLRESPRMR